MKSGRLTILLIAITLLSACATTGSAPDGNFPAGGGSGGYFAPR